MEPQLTARTADTIEAVAAEAWERIDAGLFPRTHAWQRLMEAHLVGYRPRYVLLEQGGVLLGAAITRPVEAGRIPRFLPQAAQDAVSGMLARRMRMCAAPMALATSGLLLDHDRVRELGLGPRQVVDLVLDALDHSVSQPAIVHFPVPENDGVLHPELTRRGHAPSPSDAFASIRVSWPTFQAYLDALPGKWRRVIKRVRKLAYADGIRAELVRPSEVEVPDARLHGLMAEVYRAHGAPRPPLGEGFFRSVREQLNDRAAYVLLHAEGRLVGWTLGLQHDRRIHFPLLGLDYDLAKEQRLVSMVYYEIVRAGIDLEMDEVHLGGSNLEMKRRIGCELTPRTWFMRSSPALLDRALQRAVRLGQRDAPQTHHEDGARRRRSMT